MKTIDILIAVDGAKLAQKIEDGKVSPGTQAAPTNLGAWGDSDVYISMISQSSNVTNGSQGHSELQVNANGGDIMQWTITTFGDNADQTAYLYNGSFSPSSAIHSLSYTHFKVSNYLPVGEDPKVAPTKYVNSLYNASAKIQEVGVTIQYTLSFTLVDNANGNILGYFYWDPFIKVN
jgi:hypothetical protein